MSLSKKIQTIWERKKIIFLFLLVICFWGGKKAEAYFFDPEWMYWEEEYDNYLLIRSDTTWTAAENRVVDKTILILDGATLTIEPGATIKFSRERDQWAPMIAVDNGRIVADGTESRPIIFTSDQEDSGFFFFFNNSHGQESFFRYATIEKAGGEYEVEKDVYQVFWQKIVPSALAAPVVYTGESYPVHYYQGKLRMENCIFNDPASEIEIRQENFVLSEENYLNHYLQVVNSNFIAQREQAALASDLDCDFANMDLDRIDEVCWSRTWLKNNWYSFGAGPYLVYDNFYQNYQRYHPDAPCLTTCQPERKNIFGLLVNVDGSKSDELIYDPTIIIPGIVGSEINPKTGQWVLDPILHTYDDLWKSMQDAGFSPGRTLFSFPYQWRQKNELSAVELKQKIDEIKTTTGARKVDLVAHSMGGLVARYYIESDGTNENGLNYANDVDQLITLGTPHRGSPEAYLQWEAGEGYFGLLGKLISYHFKNEAKHNGYSDIFNYIQNKILSVKQLLPDSPDYLSGVSGFSFGYPKNDFLQELNQPVKWTALLSRVRLFKIAGYKESVDDTITSYRLIASSQTGIWQDGMPENFYSNRSGILFGAGDGTVPLFSARGFSGGEGKTVNAEHRALPVETQCEIIAALGGKNCSKRNDWDFPNLLYFNVFSPLDIQIVAPNGQRIGKDFQTGQLLNEIPGAFYSGSATENEFATIPLWSADVGEYRILFQGVNEEETDRKYTVEVNLIKEKEKEETVNFSGSISSAEEKEEKIIISEGGELAGDQPVSAEELKNKFWQWWQERKISKKVWLEFREDFAYLAKWERIKNRVAENGHSKRAVILQKRVAYLKQLRWVKKITWKRRQWWSGEIYGQLEQYLQKLEDQENKL